MAIKLHLSLIKHRENSLEILPIDKFFFIKVFWHQNRSRDKTLQFSVKRRSKINYLVIITVLQKCLSFYNLFLGFDLKPLKQKYNKYEEKHFDLEFFRNGDGLWEMNQNKFLSGEFGSIDLGALESRSWSKNSKNYA